MGVTYDHYLIPEDNTYKPRPEELSRLVNALLEGGFVAEGRTATVAEMDLDLDAEPSDTDVDSADWFVRLANNKHLWFPCPCSPRDVAALGEEDYQLVCSVPNMDKAGLRYPLSSIPEFDGVYFDLELHMAADFVYHTSESIDDFDEVACPCGRDLCYSAWDDVPAAEPVESGPSTWHYAYELGVEPPKPPVYVESRIFRLCPSCGRPFRPQELSARIRDGRTGEVRRRAGGATYRFAIVIDCDKGWPRQGWPLNAAAEFRETVTRALGQAFYEIGDVSP